MKSHDMQQLIANTLLNSMDIIPHAGKVEAKHVRVYGELAADYINLKSHDMLDLLENMDDAVLNDAFAHLLEGIKDNDDHVDAHCAALRFGMAIMNEAKRTAEIKVKDLVAGTLNLKRGIA